MSELRENKIPQPMGESVDLVAELRQIADRNRSSEGSAPNSAESAANQAQNQATRAEAARRQIELLGTDEAAKEQAWEAALGEDREAREQARVAETYNATIDNMPGDVMLRRQLEAARDEATGAEKLRQQVVTKELAEQMITGVQAPESEPKAPATIGDRLTGRKALAALQARVAERREVKANMSPEELQRLDRRKRIFKGVVGVGALIASIQAIRHGIPAVALGRAPIDKISSKLHKSPAVAKSGSLVGAEHQETVLRRAGKLFDRLRKRRGDRQ